MTIDATKPDKAFELRRSYAQHRDNLRKEQWTLLDKARTEINSITNILDNHKKDSRNPPVAAEVFELLRKWASTAACFFEDAGNATLAAKARERASDDEVISASKRLRTGKGECITEPIEEPGFISLEICPYAVPLTDEERDWRNLLIDFNNFFRKNEELPEKNLALSVDLRKDLFVASIYANAGTITEPNSQAARLLREAYQLHTINDRAYYLERARDARDEVVGAPATSPSKSRAKSVILKALDEFIEALKHG